MKKSLSRIVLAVLLVASFNNRAFAWGPVGHETIAYIAQDNLTPRAKNEIRFLMSPEGSDLRIMGKEYCDLPSISNWADEIRDHGRHETGPWHYIDLPIRKNITVKDEEDYCPNDNCIINQVQIDEKILKDIHETQVKRLEALKFVVHFIGDLHMPLHCADDSDRGGNEKIVRILPPGHSGHGYKIKLHALWDGLIEIHTEENPRELASSLESKITDENKQSWVIGNLEDWALEGYLIAKNKIYLGMEPGPQDYSADPLPKDYFYRMRPLVDQQLEKAGIRLAWLLNDIFK